MNRPDRQNAWTFRLEHVVTVTDDCLKTTKETKEKMNLLSWFGGKLSPLKSDIFRSHDSSWQGHLQTEEGTLDNLCSNDSSLAKIWMQVCESG